MKEKSPKNNKVAVQAKSPPKGYPPLHEQIDAFSYYKGHLYKLDPSSRG